MGGRGSSSASANLSVGVDSAGDYPDSMNSLFNQYGTISLKKKDYAGYTRDEVEAFMASQPWEVAVIFAPDGSVADLFSDWDKRSVNTSVDMLARNIRPGSSGYIELENGYTHFHNHPVMDSSKLIQTPSPTDIDAYCSMLNWRGAGKYMPTSFSVRSQDGYSFRLDYAGDKLHSGFNDAFRTQHEDSKKLVNSYYEKHGAALYERFAANEIAARDDRWLRENASNYGFRYTSNWDIKPSI